MGCGEFCYVTLQRLVSIDIDPLFFYLTLYHKFVIIKITNELLTKPIGESMDLEQIRKKLEEANIAYRKGVPIMSDFEYDLLFDELKEKAPHDPLLNQIGYIEPSEGRKEKLPIPMASMNKVKTVKGLIDWFRLKSIPIDTELVLTPKYDGVSFCTFEYTASGWTRGDGIEGQRSDSHCKMMGLVRRLDGNFYTFGEVIMSRENWKKYEEFYANPRNMVAGLLNTKEPTIELKDCDYIRYGIKALGKVDLSKKEQLDVCNILNKVKVPYELVTIDKLSDDYLVALYKKWSKDYELDGIIVEINNANLRDTLGRETSTDNPVFARAYKGSFEEIKEAVVKDIIYQVSKHGFLKPVAIIEPTLLDGATVSKATCFNTKFIKDMGLGPCAKILIKRSGKVIPFIIKVTQPVLPNLPTQCPSCKGDVYWNDNEVELICGDGHNCPAQRKEKIIKFFELLGAVNVGEGICTQLYNNGYDTLAKILGLNTEDFLKLDGFKKKKATNVFESIRACVNGVPLSKLMHASSCFQILGTKKLKLVEHLYDTNPSLEDLTAIKGYSVRSAQAYLKGVELFQKFVAELPNVTIKLASDSGSNKCDGMIVVFTGIRRKDLEEKIEEQGGKVTTSVSKKTTHLIMKLVGSGSTKEQKALTFGTTIWDVDKLVDFLEKDFN